MTRKPTLVSLLTLIAVASWIPAAYAGPGITRTYWLAAHEVMRDYAPSSPINRLTGEAFTGPQRVFVEEGIGRKYLEALCREYTPQWHAVVERSPEESLRLGTLGPILHAEVGDTLIVHFRNNTRFPVSMHPHGVFYDKGSEGVPYADGTAREADDAVAPRARPIPTCGRSPGARAPARTTRRPLPGSTTPIPTRRRTPTPG